MVNNPDAKDKFLTTAKAAEILSVSVATLKKFIIQGKLRAVKTPGGHYRICMRDLMEELYQNSGARTHQGEK